MPKKIAFACVFAVLAIAAAFNLNAQAIPKPGEQFAAITQDGMWTWYGEPKAFYFEGTHKRTYMTWNTRSGAKGIAYYDHETLDTVVRMLPTMPYGGDDHNHPAIYVRPDGRIMICCTGHDGGEISEYISTNPEDISSWGSVIHPGGAGGYCYCNIVFLKGEGTKGRFYLFFRDAGWEPWFTTSDDWGVTWGAKLHMFTGGSYKPYCKYASDDSTEIHVVVERENRQGNSAVKPIYFMKYKGGNWYCANGRQLATMATLPVHDYDMDTIMYANRFGCSNTCYDVALDKNKNPVVVLDMFKDVGINIYWYYRWTGTSWFKRPLINSGNYRGAQSGFAAGITLDHENPDILYMCRQLLAPAAKPFDIMDTSYTNYKTNLTTAAWTTVGDVHELDKWVTKDGGVTWDSIPLTRKSANKNMLPCVPRHHKEGNKVTLMWLNGVYTSMSPDGYNCAVRIYPFNEPVEVAHGVQLRQAMSDAGIRFSQKGIAFTLVRPDRSSCAFYSVNGRLCADLTANIRGMSAGPAFLPFSQKGLSAGSYVFVLDNGKNRVMNTVNISK
jgi:hypothetical protein